MRSIPREIGCSSERTFRNREHSIGTTVSATKVEMLTATARQMANSRNRRPVSPVIRESGTSTATTAAVVAITGKPTSLEPLKAARRGGSPSSCLR